MRNSNFDSYVYQSVWHGSNLAIPLLKNFQPLRIHKVQGLGPFRRDGDPSDGMAVSADLVCLRGRRPAILGYRIFLGMNLGVSWRAWGWPKHCRAYCFGFCFAYLAFELENYILASLCCKLITDYFGPLGGPHGLGARNRRRPKPP